MSHAVSIQTAITDLEALKNACDSLGLKLKPVSRHKTPTHAYGLSPQLSEVQSVNHEIVVQKNGMRIGVYRQMDSDAYGLLMSKFTLLSSGLGEGAGLLLQAYGVAKTVIEATKKGFRVQRETQKDGTIKVLLTKVAAAT